jgi:hypothetical protein
MALGASRHVLDLLDFEAIALAAERFRDDGRPMSAGIEADDFHGAEARMIERLFEIDAGEIGRAISEQIGGQALRANGAGASFRHFELERACGIGHERAAIDAKRNAVFLAQRFQIDIQQINERFDGCAIQSFDLHSILHCGQ